MNIIAEIFNIIEIIEGYLEIFSTMQTAFPILYIGFRFYNHISSFSVIDVDERNATK